MKQLILAAMLTLPTLAAASHGPILSQSQAEASGHHVVDIAWVSPGEAVTPDCTEPTPKATPVFYACVVFPDDK